MIGIDILYTNIKAAELVLRLLLPFDFFFSLIGKIFVSPAEMVVSEKSLIGRQRRRVGRRQYKMSVAVNECTLLLRIASPKNEYKMFLLFCKDTYDGIRESLPAPVLMGAGLMGAYGKGSVEK